MALSGGGWVLLEQGHFETCGHLQINILPRIFGRGAGIPWEEWHRRVAVGFLPFSGTI